MQATCTSTSHSLSAMPRRLVSTDNSAGVFIDSDGNIKVVPWAQQELTRDHLEIHTELARKRWKRRVNSSGVPTREEPKRDTVIPSFVKLEAHAGGEASGFGSLVLEGARPVVISSKPKVHSGAVSSVKSRVAEWIEKGDISTKPAASSKQDHTFMRLSSTASLDRRLDSFQRILMVDDAQVTEESDGNEENEYSTLLEEGSGLESQSNISQESHNENSPRPQRPLEGYSSVYQGTSMAYTVADMGQSSLISPHASPVSPNQPNKRDWVPDEVVDKRQTQLVRPKSAGPLRRKLSTEGMSLYDRSFNQNISVPQDIFPGTITTKACPLGHEYCTLSHGILPTDRSNIRFGAQKISQKSQASKKVPKLGLDGRSLGGIVPNMSSTFSQDGNDTRVTYVMPLPKDCVPKEKKKKKGPAPTESERVPKPAKLQAFPLPAIIGKITDLKKWSENQRLEAVIGERLGNWDLETKRLQRDEDKALGKRTTLDPGTSERIQNVYEAADLDVTALIDNELDENPENQSHIDVDNGILERTVSEIKESTMMRKWKNDNDPIFTSELDRSITTIPTYDLMRKWEGDERQRRKEEQERKARTTSAKSAEILAGIDTNNVKVESSMQMWTNDVEIGGGEVKVQGKTQTKIEEQSCNSPSRSASPETRASPKNFSRKLSPFKQFDGKRRTKGSLVVEMSNMQSQPEWLVRGRSPTSIDSSPEPLGANEYRDLSPAIVTWDEHSQSPTLELNPTVQSPEEPTDVQLAAIPSGDEADHDKIEDESESPLKVERTQLSMAECIFESLHHSSPRHEDDDTSEATASPEKTVSEEASRVSLELHHIADAQESRNSFHIVNRLEDVASRSASDSSSHHDNLRVSSEGVGAPLSGLYGFDNSKLEKNASETSPRSVRNLADTVPLTATGDQLTKSLEVTNDLRDDQGVLKASSPVNQEVEERKTMTSGVHYDHIEDIDHQELEKLRARVAGLTKEQKNRRFKGIGRTVENMRKLRSAADKLVNVREMLTDYKTHTHRWKVKEAEQAKLESEVRHEHMAWRNSKSDTLELPLAQPAPEKIFEYSKELRKQGDPPIQHKKLMLANKKVHNKLMKDIHRHLDSGRVRRYELEPKQVTIGDGIF